MDVVIPIFDGITALDAVGPYEVLSRLPQAIQLGIEYDPQPPFHSGSLETAPRHVVELVQRYT